MKLRVRDAAGHESIARLSIRVAGGALPGRPANDDFADAATISAAAPQLRGSTANATSQAGEPAHGDGGPAHSVWARYVPAASGPATLGTCGSTIDTVLAVYTGATLASLTPIVADDNGGCSAETSRVTFSAVAGQTYWIAVDGAFSRPRRLPAVAASPAAGAGAGQRRDRERHAAGRDQRPAGHERRRDEGDRRARACRRSRRPLGLVPRAGLGRAASRRLLGELRGAAGGLHEGCDGPAPGAWGPARRAHCASSVDFTATAGVDYLIAVDGAAGATGSFRLRVRRPPANDAFASAAPFSSIASGTTALATAEPGEPAHAGSPAARSVWYTITTFSTARQVLSTCAASTAPTRIAVYEGTTLATLTPIASGGPALGCGAGRGATVAWRPPNSSKHVYRIAVDEAGPGPAEFVLESGSAPFNDDRADAARSISTDYNVFASTRFATHEDGEPDHAAAGGIASVWYALTAGRSARQRVETCDASTFSDTILAVYTPPGRSSRRIAQRRQPRLRERQQSRVEFDAVAGVTYYVAVDARSSQQGTFNLKTRMRPVNDDRAAATLLSGEALFGTSTGGSLEVATKQAGEPDHAGNAGGHSIWYRWTAPADGRRRSTRAARPSTRCSPSTPTAPAR